MPTPISGRTKLAPPEGFTVRPGSLDDIEAFTALANRCDREIVGKDTHDPDFYRILWSRPRFDPARDTRLVFDAKGAMVGGTFTSSQTPDVAPIFFGHVAPELRGRGIGTFLISWCEARRRERIELAPEGARVSMHTWVIHGHPPSEELLTARGFANTRHFVKMGMKIPETPEEPVWPEGLELRPVDRSIHDRAICAADLEGFRDHWGYFETPFEERLEQWKHDFDTDPNTDESLWFVAWDGDEVAGFLICTEKSQDDPDEGYLMVMTVLPRWRRRGLATAFLLQGIRALHERGIEKAGLHADGENLTGAVRIYRKVGMEIVHIHDNWELELRPGKELRVTGS